MSISKKEITIYPQTFTSSQQNIARNNISAVSLADVKSDICIDTMNRVNVPESNVYICLAKFEKKGGQINGNIWLNFSSSYTHGSIGFYTISVRNNSTGTSLYNKSITGQQNRSLPINLYFNQNDNYYYIIADTTGRFVVGEESYQILWQWLGYNANKAILADTTNLETFSDISDLTPVSWTGAGGIQVVDSEYLNVISKVTAESKFYNNSYDSGTVGSILFELDSSADEAYIHGVVNIVIDNNNNGTSLGVQSLLKVDFVKNTEGVDSCVIGLSEDYESQTSSKLKLYHIHKNSLNKDYLVIRYGQGDPSNVKAQWNSLTCKNVTILNTALTNTWLAAAGTITLNMRGYNIVNNEIEHARTAGYAYASYNATSATSATYATSATQSRYAHLSTSADYAITANYALGSLSANNANMVDMYHVVVGTTGTATNTIYFM
jgi:hypothetical protein